MASQRGAKTASIVGAMWLVVGAVAGNVALVTYAWGVLCVCGLWWLDVTTLNDDAPTSPRRTRG